MAEVESTAAAREQPQGALGRLAQLAWQALPAIAGAISVLGFVALVGGAIEWVRFWSAGLPADQAVRAVPREELVTIGAVSLVGFTILGLLAVLLLYLLDKRGNATPRTLTGLFVLAIVQAVVTLCFLDLPVEERLALAAGLIATGVLAYFALADLPGFLADRRAGERERRRADDALRAAAVEYRAAADRYMDAFFRAKLPPFPKPGEIATSTVDTAGLPESVDRALLVSLRQAAVEVQRAKRDWPAAVERWARAAPAGEEKHREAARVSLTSGGVPTDDELDSACTPPRTKSDGEKPSASERRKWVWLRAPVALILTVGIGLLGALGGEEERLLAVLLVSIVLLTAATFGVAYITAKFAWYGIAAFASLILFGALLNIGLVILDPKVQPVALIREGDDRALCGVYVTETDKRIYMGRVQKDGGRGEVGADGGAGRMFWIPTEDVEVVTVGPLQNLDQAQQRALELTAEIRVDRPAPESSERTYKQTIGVTSTRRRGLERTVTTERDIPEDPPQGGPEVAAPRPPERQDEPNRLKNVACRTADLTEQALERLRD